MRLIQVCQLAVYYIIASYQLQLYCVISLFYCRIQLETMDPHFTFKCPRQVSNITMLLPVVLSVLSELLFVMIIYSH